MRRRECEYLQRKLNKNLEILYTLQVNGMDSKKKENTLHEKNMRFPSHLPEAQASRDDGARSPLLLKHKSTTKHKARNTIDKIAHCYWLLSSIFLFLYINFLLFSMFVCVICSRIDQWMFFPDFIAFSVRVPVPVCSGFLLLTEQLEPYLNWTKSHKHKQTLYYFFFRRRRRRCDMVAAY